MPDQPEVQQLPERYKAFLQALATQEDEEWSAPREIRSGAIQLRGINQQGNEEFLIEANTCTGLEKYAGTRIAANDPQSQAQTGPSETRVHLRVAEAISRLLHRQLCRTWNSTGILGTEFKAADTAEDDLTVSGGILDRLEFAPSRELRGLICDIEVLTFSSEERERVLPFLWKYIIDHRDSNDHEELVAVGSAIRKYVAMLDLSRIGELASLLEPGHRVVLPLDLELELAKMIYRKFEANPPTVPDPEPQLARALWDIATAYLHPRVFLREKYATVASLAIEAVTALRSAYAQDAIRASVQCPFSWFGEMVSDNIARLRDRWQLRNQEAAKWCDDLIRKVVRREQEGENSARVPAR